MSNRTPLRSLQVWLSQTSATRLPAAQIVALLSSSELSRFTHFSRASRQHEYLLSRALLRIALSQTFNRPLDQWQPREREQTLPEIDHLPDGWRYSLSHSSGWAAVALAPGPVGIDIEQITAKRNITSLADYTCSQAEQQWLQNNTNDSVRLFYRLWCAKEACFKSLDAEHQAKTTLKDLCYSDIKNTPRQLYEGTASDMQISCVLSQQQTITEIQVKQVDIAEIYLEKLIIDKNISLTEIH